MDTCVNVIGFVKTIVGKPELIICTRDIEDRSFVSMIIYIDDISVIKCRVLKISIFYGTFLSNKLMLH